MSSLRLVIHCDYGGKTGWGHVVRSSALAALAIKHGMTTVLVTHSGENALPDDIQTAFQETVHVADRAGFYDWLQANQNMDTAIVIDSHEYTAENIIHVRHHLLDPKQPLYMITDFAPKVGIDFSGVTFVFGGVYAEMIRNTLPNYRILPGLAYSMIRDGFTEALHQYRKHNTTSDNPTQKKCVIMMGGTDPFQATPKALEYLCKALGKNVWPIVIHRKQDSPSIQAIENELKHFPQYTWLENLTTQDVARCFSEADFAITACGGTIHELALCNLPFVGIVVADNQIPFSQGIAKLWNLPVFKLNNLIEEDVIAGIKKVSEFKKIGFHFQPGIDTHGTERVLNSILSELHS